MSIVAIFAALAFAGAIGWWLNRRAGVVRELPFSEPFSEPISQPISQPDSEAGAADDTVNAPPEAALAAWLGLQPGHPAVVHFSAPWCGPCAGVRRVVDKVCADLGGVAHLEVDIDANPEAARRFAVLSLPTTVIFDTKGRQRYRVSGVPTAADLRSALEPLLA